jgi:archaellum biogenesis ATPase FlaH
MKVSPWVWVGLAVVGALAVFVQQSSQASYFRGIADDAEERLELQELVLDSVSAHADSLAAALARADSAVIAQRREAGREVARLTRSREVARERSEVLSASLRASLDSAQVVELDAVVASYEVQISALEEVIVVERSLTVAERLRATQASELVLGLRAVIVGHEASATIMVSQIAALRSSMQPSLGLRIKADWWMAAVGIGIGMVIAGR